MCPRKVQKIWSIENCRGGRHRTALCPELVPCENYTLPLLDYRIRWPFQWKNWFFSPSRPPRLVSSAIFMLCAAAKIAVLCQQKSIAIFTKKKIHMLWLWTRHKCHCVCNCNIKKSVIMHGFLDFHLLKDLIILTLLWSSGLQLWKMVWKYKLIIFYTDSHTYV